MADAVTSQTIEDGPRNCVMKFTNISDGTGESDVAKVDVSALSADPMTGSACTSVTITSIVFSTIGMGVKITLDADTDQYFMNLPADWTDTLDFTSFAGIPNNAGTGKTGDVFFTTTGHSSGDTYFVVMTMVKNYG